MSSVKAGTGSVFVHPAQQTATPGMRGERHLCLGLSAFGRTTGAYYKLLMTTIHFLILSVALQPWFPLTTQARVPAGSPGDSDRPSSKLEGLTTMAIRLQQESFRDYLDADNALFYLPRGPARSNTRLLFIPQLRASAYEVRGLQTCRALPCLTDHHL